MYLCIHTLEHIVYMGMCINMYFIFSFSVIYYTKDEKYEHTCRRDVHMCMYLYVIHV